MFIWTCVHASLLAAAVEGHAQGPQKADRHGDGRDGQHLSLVHLFALCGGAKTGAGVNIWIFDPPHSRDCVRGDGKETRKVFLLRLQWVNPTEIPPWIIQQARNISKLILWEY